MNHRLKQEMFDVMLKEALREHVRSESAALKTRSELLAENIPLHEFSPEFERRMKRLIGRQRRAAWRAKHKRAIQRAAASAALVVLVGGTAIVQVDALRVPILSFLLELGDDHSVVRVDGKDKAPVISEELQEYLPTYLPEGFSVCKVDEGTNWIDVEYMHENGEKYILSFCNTVKNGAVDTENADVLERDIQGYPAVIAEKAGRTAAVWMPDGCEYSLTGSISSDEVIRIFESVGKFDQMR